MNVFVFAKEITGNNTANKGFTYYSTVNGDHLEMEFTMIAQNTSTECRLN